MCAAVRAATSSVETAATPFYRIAVLVIGRKGSDDSVGRVTPDAFSALVDELKADGFSRIFVLDCCNEQSLTLSTEDQSFLLALFLQFLVRYAVREAPAVYEEWLLNEAGRESILAGISALSIAFPVEQALEFASLYHGGRAWSALLLSIRQEHDQFYLDSFLLRAGLSSWEEAQHTISEYTGVALQDPLSDAPPAEPGSEKTRLDTLKALNDGLAAAAQANHALMERIAGARLNEWKQAIEDHLDSILLQETGGLAQAQKFAGRLAKHAAALMDTQPPQLSFEDPREAIERLEAVLARMPEPPALVLRTAAAGAALDSAGMIVDTGLATRVTLLVGPPLAIAAVAAIQYHACRQRLIDGFAVLEGRLRAKWDALMAVHRAAVARECLRVLTAHVEHLSRELENAIVRVGEVAAYFHDTYQPTLPAHGSLSKQAVQNRADLEAFAGACNVLVDEEAAAYLRRAGRTPFLWRRLAARQTKEPNSFEFHSVEEFASQVLASCSPVLEVNVLALIESHAELKRSFENMMAFYAGPFLRLREANLGNRFGLLESLPGQYGPLRQRLADTGAQHLTRVDLMDNGSPYRVAMYGFLQSLTPEGIFLGN